MATAQGKQGIWFLLFPDRENTGNFVLTQGKICQHRENIWTVIINIKSMFIFFNFKNFEPRFARHNFLLQNVMYICSHMLCVPILPVYLLSVSVYSCIIFIWDIKQTCGGCNFKVITFDYIYAFF